MTSFHQGSNAQIEELFPCSSLQQGVGGGGGETGEGGWPANVGLGFRSHLMLERAAGRRTAEGDCESAKVRSKLRVCLSPEIFDRATTTASRRLRFAFFLFFRSSSRRLEISISKSHI